MTTPKKLGCQRPNGGLLTGNMLVRSPEHFGAIVCQVPLLDMRRFHKLLAGASWMGEYGDPEEEWDAFLSQYSPYHLVDEATTYPPILFTTSTRDDRVHPGHARKMVRKLLDLGKGATTHYYENIEGGHGGAADNKQRAFMQTLAFTFLERTLAGGEGAPAAAPLSMDESEAPAGFVWVGLIEAFSAGPHQACRGWQGRAQGCEGHAVNPASAKMITTTLLQSWSSPIA